MMRRKISVWIVEDDIQQRHEIRQLINSSSSITCSNTFGSCEALLTHIKTTQREDLPEVVILDYQLDGFDLEEHMTGIDGAGILKKSHPEIAIIMLTINDSTDVIFQAIGSGACGYIIKPPRLETLHSAIQQANRGGLWMPPMVAQRVSDYFQEHMPGRENVLSDREKEVLVMMERGLKQKQIADELSLSRHTVDSHLRRIYQKLHVNSAPEALAKAIRKGYV